jgi:hypothetical protein
MAYRFGVFKTNDAALGGEYLGPKFAMGYASPRVLGGNELN